MRHILPALLALASVACASAPAADDLGAYPRLLAGTWSNRSQYAVAPDDMKHPPAGPNDDWLDQVAVTFTPAAAPFKQVGALAEWRDGTGKVLGRGLWVFRRDGAALKLDLYEFQNLSTLVEDEPVPKGPGCALAVTAVGAGAFNAQTDPDTCLTGGAHLDIRITAMPTGILYQELKRADDGAFISRAPGGVPYDLRRTP